MIKAALHGNGLYRDNIFKLDDPSNRDECNLPYFLLKRRLAMAGVDLATGDLHPEADIVIHANLGPTARGFRRTYLLMLEPPNIIPGHEQPWQHDQYDAIFTWDDRLVDGERYIKINLPNRLRVPAIDGLVNRPLLSAMIAGNKTGAKPDQRDLYKERVKAIRWFERHAADDFALFGAGWNTLPPRRGLTGAVLRRLQALLSKAGWVAFPSYRGRLDRKQDVLEKTRFPITFENTRDIPGYITEKIFDAMFAGAVPIYWGADNVTDYIPGNCFIDYRDFSSIYDIYQYIKSVDSKKYREYQKNIADFIESDAAFLFGNECFVSKITAVVLNDR